MNIQPHLDKLAEDYGHYVRLALILLCVVVLVGGIVLGFVKYRIIDPLINYIGI